jgi:hypothetical protein
MSDDWWFRRGDERVVWRGQPRLSAALPGVGVGVAVCTLAAAAAVLVDPRAAVGVVIGVGVVAWALLRVRRTEYLLTTRVIWLETRGGRPHRPSRWTAESPKHRV